MIETLTSFSLCHGLCGRLRQSGACPKTYHAQPRLPTVVVSVGGMSITDASPASVEPAMGGGNSAIAAAKRAARHAALARRKTVTATEFTQAQHTLGRYAGLLCRTLPGHATVAAYASMGTEPPMDDVLADLLDTGMRVLVPRLGPGADDAPAWSELDGLASLHDMPRSGTGGLRPREPGTRVLAAEALNEAALILVPAFAIDTHGIRLGRGAGWYDRALTHASPSARIVGVCWPWELTDTPVPHVGHDVPVHGVLTPAGLRMIRPLGA